MANLGPLEEPAIAALKTALQAGRTGKSVVVAEEVGAQMVALSVAQSLAYLDVAVLWALWNELGLRALLDRVLPGGRQEVSSTDVVFALVAQRSLAPGSKLSAERWVPTTALPELLGVAPGALNNARIHRVLEALDEASEDLQEELAPPL